ncbi:MAG: hypothetical protein U9Q63_00625 [Patescibacteria group bacterium]|nr:hypothetical protein [Patescibacteria group bacterium]
MPESAIDPTIANTGLDDKYVALLAARNRAAQSISQKIAQAIEKYLPEWTPSDLKQEFLQTASESISHHTLEELKKHPNLDPKEYAQAEKNDINQALKNTAETYEAFTNLLKPQDQKQLSQELEKVLSLKEAQEVAQVSNQVDKLEAEHQFGIQSPQDLAETILNKVEKDYGVSKEELSNILDTVPSQTANLPIPSQINQAVKQALSENLPPATAEQLYQEIQPHQDLIHNFIHQSVKPLKQESPYTPYSFTVAKQTHHQAHSLNLDPLALAYVKKGFPADHPQLPKHLQQKVANIYQVFENPSQFNLSQQLTVAKLAPSIFIAKKFYFPAYSLQQQTQQTANKLITKPFKAYQKTTDIYNNYLSEYRDFIKTKPAGWLLSPRMRSRLAIDKLKLGTKRWTRYQFLKNSKRGKFYRKTRKTVKDTKEFIGNWSPRGLVKRGKKWTVRQISKGASKTGKWIIKKSSKKFGQAIGKGLVKLGSFTLKSGSVLFAPLVMTQMAFSFGKIFLRKLKKQIRKSKENYNLAGVGARVFQAIITGIKTLGATIFGSVFGLAGGIAGAIIGAKLGAGIGATIGTAIVPGVGTAIGAFIGTAGGGVIGFFTGGFALGSLGALIGWNWMTIAAIPATIGAMFFGPTGFLGGGFTGTTAATLATSVTTVSLATATIPPILSSYQQQQTLNSAFFLPNSPGFNGDCLLGFPIPKEHDCTEEIVPLPFPNNSSSPIARRAYEIVNNLSQGFWCYWNWSKNDYPNLFDENRYRKDPFPTKNIGFINMFWCTWLPIKSYQEAGPGLSNGLLNAQNMQDSFNAQNKFIVNNPGVNKKIAPGNVMFLQNHFPEAPNRTNHVAIVYSVGSKSITTIESNAPTKTRSYAVDNIGHIENNGSLEVIGFGQP